MLVNSHLETIPVPKIIKNSIFSKAIERVKKGEIALLGKLPDFSVSDNTEAQKQKLLK